MLIFYLEIKKLKSFKNFKNKNYPYKIGYNLENSYFL